MGFAAKFIPASSAPARASKRETRLASFERVKAETVERAAGSETGYETSTTAHLLKPYSLSPFASELAIECERFDLGHSSC